MEAPNGIMKPQRGLFYIGGHGAKAKGEPLHTRSMRAGENLIGSTNSEIYTPVGHERKGVESGQIAGSIFTNTSLIPSLLVYILCFLKVDIHSVFFMFITLSQILDNLAGVKPSATGQDRNQINTVNNKPFWFFSMGEHIRVDGEGEASASGHSGRLAANDPIHFPLGLWCVLVHDDEGNIPGLIDQTMREYMIQTNCGSKLKTIDEFKKKKELTSILKSKGIPIINFIEPFEISKTSGVRRHFNDLNIFSSKNLLIFEQIIRQNVAAAIARLPSQQYPDDKWLIENATQAMLTLRASALTKHSTLRDIEMICKALMPPGTDLQFIDETCSSDYTMPHSHQAVMTLDDMDTPPGSFPRTPPPSSQSSSQSSSHSLDDSHTEQEFPGVEPGWWQRWHTWYMSWITPPPPPSAAAASAAPQALPLLERNASFDRLHTQPSAARKPQSSTTHNPQSSPALKSRPHTPSPPPPGASGASGGSRKSHKNPKNRNKSKRKVRSTKRKTQKIRRRRK